MSKLLIGVTVGGLAIYGLNAGISGVKESMLEVLNTPVISNSEQTDFKQIIVSELSSHSKLVTTTVVARPDIETVVEREFFDRFTIGSMRVKIYGHVTINTGIDLSKIGPEDLIIEGDRLTINAPAIEIISTELDPTQSQIVIITEGLSNFSKQYQAEIIQSTQGKLVSEAINSICDSEMNFIEHTENSVREALENLIKPIGFVEINVNFEDPC